MKAGYLLSSLCLAPLSLAAPLVQTSVLVAGTSTKAIVVRPGAQSVLEEATHLIKDIDSEAPQHTFSLSLGSERPLTTAQLMSLVLPDVPSPESPKPASPEESLEKPKAAKGAVSVGALVAPSSKSGNVVQLIDLGNIKPYLVPGYYVSSQRADVLIVVLIVACVLIVIAVETSSLIVAVVSDIFRSAKGGSCLEDEEAAAVDLKDCELDSGSEDVPPFGRGAFRDEQNSLLLPEKLDEKATWI